MDFRCLGTQLNPGGLSVDITKHPWATVSQSLRTLESLMGVNAYVLLLSKPGLPSVPPFGNYGPSYMPSTQQRLWIIYPSLDALFGVEGKQNFCLM
jgi:hypothetical protein